VARRNGIEIGVALDAFSKDVAIAEFLIAHNAQFDRNIICDELLRVGRNDILAGKNLYCTMQSSADFCKIKRRHGYKWPNLEELHISLFGDTFDDAHNALSDARACAKCFFELRRRGVEFGNQVSNDHTGSDDDYLTIEDQELLDELETLEEFLRRSERKWVNRFIAQFQLTRQLSEKQRNILSSIRFKAEDRV
jgi:DNA polymerase III epsilon subunit-like protein